jgi:chromosome segregation ATPase
MTFTEKMARPVGWGHQAEGLALTRAPFRMFAAIAKQMRRLRPAGDELICRENEVRSLEISLDLVVSENTRLCERLAEKNATIDDAHLQLEQAKAALAASEAECNKAAAALDAANEKNKIDNETLIRCIGESNTALDRERFERERVEMTLPVAAVEHDKLAASVAEANDKLQIETESFNIRLKALSARADAAEKMLAVLRQSLFDKLDRLQAWHEAKMGHVQDLEVSRSKLIGGTGALRPIQMRSAEILLAHTLTF